MRTTKTLKKWTQNTINKGLNISLEACMYGRLIFIQYMQINLRHLILQHQIFMIFRKLQN